MTEIFYCKACKYQTKYSGNYNKHINTQKHHQKLDKSIACSNINTKKQIPPPPQGKFPHLCKKCGKKYSRKDSLKRHQSTCSVSKNSNTLNTFGAQNNFIHIKKNNPENGVFSNAEMRCDEISEESRKNCVKYNVFNKDFDLHNFVCKLCKKKYLTEKELLEHKPNCLKKNYDTITENSEYTMDSTSSKNHNKSNSVDNSNSSSISHTGTKLNKTNPHNSLKLEKYKNKLIQKKIIISSKDELLEHYKQELNYMRGMLDTAGGMANKAVGSLTHIVNNYENAPPLEKAKISELLKIKNINVTFKNKKEKEMMIIEEVFSAYNHGTIGQYIGDIIISMYKKKDPELQSIWATDTSRLTYLIKKQEKKYSRWVVDKKGVETMKYVIEPIIQKIKELSRIYLDSNPPSKYDDMEKIVIIEKTYMNIINDIDDKKLHQKVLKYISSHFYFDKSKNSK